MARLNGVIETLRELDRAEWGDTVLDEIIGARDEDDTIFHEKVGTLETELEGANKVISELKNELYDTLKLIPGNEDVDTEESDTEDPEVDDDHDPIDDFFEEVN